MEWIAEALTSAQFTRMRMAVAYAKEGALLRLKPAFDSFLASGGTIEAVFGIDQCGTSDQALAFALRTFTHNWVWQHPNLMVTFHPKLYLFDGPTRAEAQIGSCNMTTGGLETNCEAATRLAFGLPDEIAAWGDATAGWTSLLAHPNLRVLDETVRQKLAEAGLTFDESTRTSINARQPKSRTARARQFPSTPFRPPSPRPARLAAAVVAVQAQPSVTTAAVTAAVVPPVMPPAPVEGLPTSLLIQIVPHDNGEVFLSRRAIVQYPAFFDFPFTGWAVPKGNNAPYPQRLPDPVTDWTVHDANGVAVLVVPGFGLNTIYYEAKKEIRVTISSALRNAIPEYSILQMTRIDDGTTDYSCDVFPPNSPQFQALLPACNQEMPSGGKPIARRFGWI